MIWVSFLAKSIFVLAILWFGGYYGYAEILKDTIVPLGTMSVAEWVYMYQVGGYIAVGTVFVTSLLWFLRGVTYKGKGNVAPIYYLLFVVCLVVGIAVGKWVFAPFVYGGEWTLWIAVITTPLAYYVISLIGSPDAVKYVPPLSTLIR